MILRAFNSVIREKSLENLIDKISISELVINLLGFELYAAIKIINDQFKDVLRIVST